MNKITIKLDTPDGTLERDYAYDQSPDELLWDGIVEDMIDSIQRSAEATEEKNLDHHKDNQI